ncbi:hypothetical protein PWT90_06732 [Aphanocladium album]|nr:hypothetical protein PWT90_06732 [Aphanocladium album]
MPKQIFKNRVIAIAEKPPPSITLEHLRRWISLRKGRFSETFDEEVTHLLCTHEEFKKRVPLGIVVISSYFVVFTFFIAKVSRPVHYDWLEFSAVANRRLPERQYSMRTILAKQRAEERERKRLQNGRRLGERSVNPNFFHVYRDREFFLYQIELTRDSCDDDEFMERRIMTLWESNAKPHLYWFTVKYMRRKGDPDPAYHRPSPCSGKWRKEMNKFMEFFEKATKIPWPKRVLLQGTTDRTVFQYAPPTGGKPVGRRLCLSYDHCVAANLEIHTAKKPLQVDTEADADSSEEGTVAGKDATEDNDNHDDATATIGLGDEFGCDQSSITQHTEIKDPASSESRLSDGSSSPIESMAEVDKELSQPTKPDEP